LKAFAWRSSAPRAFPFRSVSNPFSLYHRVRISGRSWQIWAFGLEVNIQKIYSAGKISRLYSGKILIGQKFDRVGRSGLEAA